MLCVSVLVSNGLYAVFGIYDSDLPYFKYLRMIYDSKSAWAVYDSDIRFRKVSPTDIRFRIPSVRAKGNYYWLVLATLGEVRLRLGEVGLA